MNAIPVIYREELREYDFGPGHPFRGDRYKIFPQFLKDNLVQDRDFTLIETEPAGEEDLLLVADRAYMQFNQAYYKAANLGLSLPTEFFDFQTPDNMPKSRAGKVEEAARLIIGQAKKACDMVLEDSTDKVVVLGGGMHHAGQNHGEGFCIYNDVAFSALYLQQKYSLDRILILDTDAHTGNGTTHYFYDDPNVLLIDIHQDPRSIYPGTGFTDEIGAGDGRGYTVNIPMPLFAGQKSYQLAFDEIIKPVVDEFKPEIIIRNGGSDPHVADELTDLGLEVAGFRMIGEQVREMASVCDGRVIDLIGSGYNREVLPYCWMALICGLTGIDLELEEPEHAPAYLGVDRSMGEMKVVIQEVKNNLGSFWKCLQ